MPGIAASTSDTWLFGAPPNSVEAPENSFALDATCACTSMPMTTSQSPVAPRMRLVVFASLMLRGLPGCLRRSKRRLERQKSPASLAGERAQMSLRGIIEQWTVACHQGVVVFARRGGKDTIDRIVWRRSWKVGRRDQDMWRQADETKWRRFE